MRFALALLAACGSSPAPPLAAHIDPELPPPTRFALLDSATRQLRVLAVVPGKPRLATERIVDVPEATHAVVWAGPSAIAVTSYDEGHGTISVVEGRTVARVPDIVWPDVPQPPQAVFGDELWAYTTDHQAELILASCAWRQPDGFEYHGPCQTWQYARLWPAPIAVLPEVSAVDPALFPLPKVTAGSVTAVVAKDGQSVRCTDAHGSHDLPPPEPGGLEVAWLVADPPLFRLDTTSGSGMGTGYTTHRIFEGCAPSTRFTDAFAGPRGEIVLVGRELAVYWHGRLAATGPGSTRDESDSSSTLAVAFAPP